MLHQGKKALITGGTRGIGKAIALHLAREGCELVLNYLDKEDHAQSTLKEIQDLHAQAHLIQANLADPDEARRLAEASLSRLGSIDYFIHCAALGAFKPVDKLKLNQWDLSFDINVKSFLILCQKLSKNMSRGASIIALSSSGAQKVVPNYGAMGIAKAGLEALVRYLAVEYITQGIRVNTVSAGFVDTQSLEAFPEHARMRDAVAERTPAGRIGKPEDLTGLVSFLLSKEAGWIVGQTILADGGLSLV